MDLKLEPVEVLGPDGNQGTEPIVTPVLGILDPLGKGYATTSGAKQESAASIPPAANSLWARFASSTFSSDTPPVYPSSEEAVKKVLEVALADGLWADDEIAEPAPQRGWSKISLRKWVTIQVATRAVAPDGSRDGFSSTTSKPITRPRRATSARVARNWR